MKTQISRLVRSRCSTHLLDDSGMPAQGAAIYTLSDPRDVRLVRYVGQTRSPQQRFRQHINTARLWMPDELPWWVAAPRMRPLSHWIRELYRDECRLPLMRVIAWTEANRALLEERHHISECLLQQLPLLNREAEIFRRQPQLF
jgi:hypothetical protein